MTIFLQLFNRLQRHCATRRIGDPNPDRCLQISFFRTLRWTADFFYKIQISPFLYSGSMYHNEVWRVESQGQKF